MEIAPGCAQTVVRIRPVRFEPQCGFKFIRSLARIAFVFQRESEIVVGQRVPRFKLQRLPVSCNGFVPRLGTSKFRGLLPVSLGCLREGNLGVAEREKEDQQSSRQPALVNQRIGPSAIHGSRLS